MTLSHVTGDPTARSSPLDWTTPASARTVLTALGALRHGALTMHLPNGRVAMFGDGAGPAVDMRVNDYGFARRVLFSGDIGFADGWMAGEWDTTDLPALLTYLLGNYARIERYISGSAAGRLINFIRHLSRANTRTGSRRNILQHYDLGNRFYQSWLDPTMTYSSARFETATQTLEDAQRAKYRALGALLDLKPGEHVLEIGCGWGGFAQIAAQEFGARVTAITISDEQLAFARRRIARAGLGERVTVQRRDYRDISGQFDKIASIEMFEAVGELYWPVFFAKLTQALKPGGRAALQTITIRDDLFSSYRLRSDFIQRYVFPGGMLPSLARLRDEAVRGGLKWIDATTFGPDYARTLAMWSARFEENWPVVQALGFDARFRRLWTFYLAYCAAGFNTGHTNVAHVSVIKPA